MDHLTIPHEKLREYFPESYTPLQMEEQIIKLLESWCRRRKQSLER